MRIIVLIAFSCVCVLPAHANKPSPDCVLWFDGCNTCTAEQGTVKCTKKYCHQKKAPRCLKMASPEVQGPSADCVRWFDGCNTCTVEQGEVKACTRKHCTRREQARCVQVEGR